MSDFCRGFAFYFRPEVFGVILGTLSLVFVLFLLGALVCALGDHLFGGRP